MTAYNLSILAAQSLCKVLPEVIALYEKETQNTVEVRYGHSSELRAELEGHLPCDVLLGADLKTSKALVDEAQATEPFVYAGNRLMVVTRNERRFQNSTWLSLLCDPSVSIGLCNPIVCSEGEWAKMLFKNIGAKHPEITGSKIIDQHSVPLIGGVASGEDLGLHTGAAYMLQHGVDAVVVYSSDRQRVEKEDGLKIYDIDELDVIPQITYVGCRPRSGKAPKDAARSFIAFILSPAAQEILQKGGFQPAPAGVKF